MQASRTNDFHVQLVEISKPKIHINVGGYQLISSNFALKTSLLYKIRSFRETEVSRPWGK